jgi:hypothetical protein
MTTADLTDRLASGHDMDAPLFREVVRGCGITLDLDDDRLVRLMEMILIGAWRDACSELQAVVLPGWYFSCDQDYQHAWSVMLSNPEWSNGHEGTHPTSECRAHLIAILRARKAQG